MINRITRQTLKMCGRCVAVLTLYNPETSHHAPAEQSWEVCLNDLINYHGYFTQLDKIVPKIPRVWKKISATALTF